MNSSTMNFWTKVVLRLAVEILGVFKKIADAARVHLYPIKLENVAFGIPCVAMGGSNDTRWFWKFLITGNIRSAEWRQ